MKVSYAVTPDNPPAQPQANPQVQTAAAPQQSAPISTARRAPISPYARAPYTWIMQSVIVRGSNPRKYTAPSYVAPTDGTMVGPLTLPAGATIVDVFPSDCMFSLRIKRATPSPSIRERKRKAKDSLQERGRYIR